MTTEGAERYWWDMALEMFEEAERDCRPMMPTISPERLECLRKRPRDWQNACDRANSINRVVPVERWIEPYCCHSDSSHWHVGRQSSPLRQQFFP